MKKILIIKLSALGDLFLALPHMETILQHHATDEVHLITSPAFMPLFEHHPRLRVIPLNRKHHFFGHSALARAWWIQRQCFDVVYDLQGNRTSRRLVRFSRAGKRVGTQPNRIYTHHPAAFYRDDSPQSVFDRLNETLVAGGLSSAQTTCTLYPSDAQRRAVARWKLAQQLTDQRYVVLHAGSSRDWPAKRWPEDHFGALADRLTARALRVVWIGGPDDH
ncbi:MAG: glycosyltransferase family 9 protein, partial [Desulfatitalea sp.]|nr:hypothetical protein [Desulfatitalea sp.]NNK00889.1 glycosyltransferase family 9 protein [Desulfatitalea sp.]